MEAGAGLRQALQAVAPRLEGAFALAVVDSQHPDCLVAARRGSPLVLGLGIGENFLASDQLALRQVTDRFIYLEDGDLAELQPGEYRIWDGDDQTVEREVVSLSDVVEQGDRGDHSHYMYKEIFEQPDALQRTLAAALSDGSIADGAFGEAAAEVFDQVRGVQIVACGTSYHAGLVGRYWLEEWAGIPCQVEVASEFRYRKRMQHKNTLLVTVSQSGETADTLAALRNVEADEFDRCGIYQGVHYAVAGLPGAHCGPRAKECPGPAPGIGDYSGPDTVAEADRRRVGPG
jgi:glucosamine--fructose-6-phosphate aminotransferase (isomerizing)